MIVRDRIKKILSSRIFYVIFAILASVSLWLYVSYIENPDITVTVRGVKIELQNQDYVTDKGLIITAINTDTVTLRFTGKRNIVTRLTNTNVVATVDLSDVKAKGVAPLEYVITYPIDINPTTFTTAKSVDFITITVDTLEDKEIPVRGTYDGGVAEGYQAEPIELTPASIIVSGPQEVLSKISYAWVPVHRQNLSKTVEEKLTFTLMDDSGHEVISDKLSFSQDTINVVIPVVMLKEIPLTVNLVYGPGVDSTNSVYKITPSSIMVSGDAETLNELNQISLGPIDLNKFLNSKTFEFPIVLPNGTTNLTGLAEAAVTVSVTGLDSTHLNVDNIQMKNVPAGYTATVVTKNLEIVLRGRTEELNKVTSANMRIEADLTELGATTGTYSVLTRINIDGDFSTVGPIGEYKVTVTLTKD